MLEEKQDWNMKIIFRHGNFCQSLLQFEKKFIDDDDHNDDDNNDDDDDYTLIWTDKDLSFYCMSWTTGMIKSLFNYKVWTHYEIKYQYNLIQSSYLSLYTTVLWNLR